MDLRVLSMLLRTYTCRVAVDRLWVENRICLLNAQIDGLSCDIFDKIQLVTGQREVQWMSLDYVL
jgi:hypothetical protein